MYCDFLYNHNSFIEILKKTYAGVVL